MFLIPASKSLFCNIGFFVAYMVLRTTFKYLRGEKLLADIYTMLSNTVML
jgi:hypothetical protein